jgi:TonB family protein
MRKCVLATVFMVVGTVFLSAPLSSAQEESSGPKRQLINRVMPAYPDLARKMSIRGSVRLLLVVAPGGQVKSAKVLGGNPVLAKAAEDAVLRWTFASAPAETEEPVELRFNPQ